MQEQGGGSYMRFASEYMTIEQIVPLMDAIRIGFLDNQNDLIAIAKLNTSNFEETEEGISAALHLYHYSVAADGSISMGERLKEDAAITALPEGMPVVLTVVVWLDGDHVENSYVATNAQSITGVLNLQFASSAELQPAYRDDSDETSSEEMDPEEPTPTVPDEAYYLGEKNGQYSFYTLNAEGGYDYELHFEGTVNEETHTIIVESVSQYPEDGVVIPALVAYAGDDTRYSVSIDPSAPFETLVADTVDIRFLPISGSKVGITDTVLSNLFDASEDKRTVYHSLDLSGLDISSATDMSFMFSGCSGLTELNVGGFDTTNVTDMSKMFYDCASLPYLDLSGWDMDNADTTDMFVNCPAEIKYS
jgi:surface protein